MTRDSIANIVYILYRQKSTNTDLAAATDMITLINEGYTQMMGEVWPDTIDSTVQYTVPITTVVTRTSATSWILTDVTGFVANTDVCIRTGDRYDVGRITDVTPESQALTLASPGILYTHVSGAIVTPVSFVVSDCRYIRSMMYQITTTTKNEITEILPMTNSDMFRLGYTPKSYGTPTKYAPWTNALTEIRVYPVPSETGYINMRYGAKSAYTLAGANASPVLDTDTHMGIIYWCLFMLALRERDHQASQSWYMLYQTMVLKARSAIVRRKEEQSKMTLKKGAI